MRARNPVRGGAASLLFFIALILAARPAFGQPPYPGAIAGLSVGGLFPSGSFNSHVGRDGLAIGLTLALRSGFSSALVGFELSGGYYGHSHRHVPMAGVPEIVFDVDTYNNILQGLFVLRFQPKRLRPVMPFVEGLAGGSYFFTDTSVSDDAGEQAYDVNFHDWTVTGGVGGGIFVPFGRHRRAAVEIKVRYLAGGRATYLKQGSLIVDGDRVTYVSDRSTTSFVTLQLGLVALF